MQAEALACLQQLHMFAPSHLDLGTVVPELVALLTSPHLSLRYRWSINERCFGPTFFFQTISGVRFHRLERLKN